MRLDVDDLGAIFNYGLNPPSIKRVASLSREMQVFFAGMGHKTCYSYFASWVLLQPLLAKLPIAIKAV